MRTAETVQNTGRRALEHNGLNRSARAANLTAARVEIASLLGAKDFGPFETNDKLSRLGDKVVASALAAGGSADGVAAFVRALPLPMTAYQRELFKSLSFRSRSVSEREGIPVAPTSTPQANDGPMRLARDEAPQETLATFQAADGTVVAFRRALLANCGSTLLSQMASGEWHDQPSAAGHLQLPTVPKRQLELVRAHLYQELELKALSDADLAIASQAARYFGCETLELAVDDERRHRRLAPIFLPTLANELWVETTFDLRLFLQPFQRALEEQVLRSPRQNTIDLQVQVKHKYRANAEALWDYGASEAKAALKEFELCLLRAGFLDIEVSVTQAENPTAARITFTL